MCVCTCVCVLCVCVGACVVCVCVCTFVFTLIVVTFQSLVFYQIILYFSIFSASWGQFTMIPLVAYMLLSSGLLVKCGNGNTHTHIHTHTHVHTHTHTYTHTYTQAHTHTPTHAHNTHTHTYTHISGLWPLASNLDFDPVLRRENLICTSFYFIYIIHIFLNIKFIGASCSTIYLQLILRTRWYNSHDSGYSASSNDDLSQFIIESKINETIATFN